MVTYVPYEKLAISPYNVRRRVVKERVGDVFVSRRIREDRASFGGEPCGAWVFPEFSLSPDGPYSALFVAELVSREGKLSELLSEIPVYPIIRYKFGCENREQVMKNVKNIVKERGYKFIGIDGVRIEFEDGWVLLRPSGTEPVFRVTAEGKDRELAEKYFGLGISILKEAGV